VQWAEGKLSNDGEAIQLLNQYGMVADYVKYDKTGNWPVAAFNSETVLSLIDPKLDNHFPESWKSTPLLTSSSLKKNLNESTLRIFPNPAINKITIYAEGKANSEVEIYSSLGQLVKSTKLNQDGSITIEVSEFQKGIYLVRVRELTTKILITK
jgi:hypothetical protein